MGALRAIVTNDPLIDVDNNLEGLSPGQFRLKTVVQSSFFRRNTLTLPLSGPLFNSRRGGLGIFRLLSFAEAKTAIKFAV